MLSDIQLIQTVSPSFLDDYKIALEFLKSKPDYSLVKFRHIVERICIILANVNNFNFNSNNLYDQINELHEQQIINKPLFDNLHKVRVLGNHGAHKSYDKSEYDEKAEEYIEKIKAKQKNNAVNARVLIVSIFEDINFHLNGVYLKEKIKLTEIKDQEFKDIIFNAMTTADYKLKLKAGLICDALRDDFEQTKLSLYSHDFLNNIEYLTKMAANFYEAAYKTSVKLDDCSDLETELFAGEENSLPLARLYKTLKECDLESLYRYSVIALSGELGKEAKEESIGFLQCASEREYIPATAELGQYYYFQGDYIEAYKHLEKAGIENDVLALRTLFCYYSEGDACRPNRKQALPYIEQSILLGCNDSLALLGIAYNEGKIFERDEVKAEMLVNEAMNKGSILATNYFIKHFVLLKSAKNAISFAMELGKLLDPLYEIPKKTKVNEPCPCGSGIKFKKCCRTRLNESADDKYNQFLNRLGSTWF